MLWARRGALCTDVEEAVQALSGRTLDELKHPAPCPPEGINGLENAAEVIMQAALDARPAVIIGDYDADGITATAILSKLLTAIGVRHTTIVPRRVTDGYGVSDKHVQDLHDSLIITVDNGISAGRILDACVERRNTVVVIDHHFFDACKGTFYDELFTVAVLTGLRPGELFALTWEDIDLKARTISITKTLLYQKLEGDSSKVFHVHPPKTETSNRIVHFDERCALALKSQFRKKSNIALRTTSSPLPGLESLLFVTKYNTPLNASIYNSAIQRIVDLINESRCELERFETLSGHCFRHTYATRCFEAGVDPKVVQKQLGHASLKMTMDLYTHLFEDKKVEELDKFTSYSESVFTSSDCLKERRYREALHPKIIAL